MCVYVLEVLQEEKAKGHQNFSRRYWGGGHQYLFCFSKLATLGLLGLVCCCFFLVFFLDFQSKDYKNNV